MKQIINQRGYALLIVLFTIIIFLSVSAVFMSSSLNHVTQEKKVDMNNQAVVAAEMGTKFIEVGLNEKIKSLYFKHQVDLQNTINSLNACTQYEQVNCKNELKIRSLENERIKKYKKELIEYFNEINYKKDIDTAKGIYFKVNVQNVIGNEEFLEQNSIDFIFNIVGYSRNFRNQQMTKDIRVDMNVENPKFINSINNSGNDNSNTNILEKNNNFFDVPISQGNCSDPKFLSLLSTGFICELTEGSRITSLLGSKNDNEYSKITIISKDFNSSFCNGDSCSVPYNNLKVYAPNQNIDANKVMGLNNIALYLDGSLNLDSNGKGFDGVAVVKTVSAGGHLKNITGILFIQGDTNSNVNISINNQFGTKNNEGKICLNLDGININGSDFNSIKNEDRIIFYSASGRTIPFGTEYDGNSYMEFVKSCIGTSRTPVPSLTLEYGNGENNSKFIVDYLN